MVTQTKTYDNLPIIDAMASATGNHVGALKGPAISSASPDMKVSAIVGNIDDAAQKLGTIGRLRQMGTDAIQNASGPAAAPLNTPEGMRQMVGEQLFKLGITNVVTSNPGAAAPSDGATYGMAPVQTAALGGAPSSFKLSSSSDRGSSRSAMPDEGGWQYGGATSVSPVIQAQFPHMAATDLQAEQEGVNSVIASRGKDKAAKELGAGLSTAERDLELQAVAARDLALKDFGVNSPDLLIQRSGPQLGQGPQVALEVAAPKAAGPKAFGGIFG